MRLAKNVVEEREQFLTDLFRQNPNTTQRAANGALKEKYGTKMRPHRVYALKRGVVQPSLPETTE